MIVTALYQTFSEWDLAKIFAQLGIKEEDVVDYEVKYDFMSLTYTDSDGNTVEQQFAPNVFCASKEYDYKWPEEVIYEDQLVTS